VTERAVNDRSPPERRQAVDCGQHVLHAQGQQDAVGAQGWSRVGRDLEAVAVGQRAEGTGLRRQETDVPVTLDLVTRHGPQRVRGRTIARQQTADGRCPFRFCMYGSRSYWEKNRDRPLEELSWVLPDDGIDFFPSSLWRKKVRERPSVTFTSESATATLEAVRQGLGAAPIPCFLADPERRLVRITDPPEELTLTLWVLIHPDLRNTARVQALVSVLYDGLLRHRDALMGQRGSRAGRPRARPT